MFTGESVLCRIDPLVGGDPVRFPIEDKAAVGGAQTTQDRQFILLDIWARNK